MKNPDFSKIDFKANFESQSYEAWKAEIEKNTGMKFEELIEKSMENIDVFPINH